MRKKSPFCSAAGSRAGFAAGPPVREQVDWDDVRRRTAESPYAKAFFTLVEELGVVNPRPTVK